MRRNPVRGRIPPDGACRMENVHDGTGKEEDTMFPSWGQDEVLPVTDISVRSVETCPVPLFTEASLLSEMERCGLGTPSTRAGVIELLIARRYVERQGCDLLPTRKGWRCMRPSGTS